VSVAVDPGIDTEREFERGLRGYLDAVATAVGVGAESYTMDLDTPVSAYVAVDRSLSRFPGRDVALLWDEREGWSVAVETHSGEDLIVVARFGGTVIPDPRTVARFLDSARVETSRAACAAPATLRLPGNHHELTAELARWNVGSPAISERLGMV